MQQINFKFPLRIGQLGYFDMNTNTKDAVKENLKLTVLTTKGERLINEVGSAYSFDLFTQTKEEVKSSVTQHTKDIFDAYFNFLKIEKIDVLLQEDNNSLDYNQVYVKITYSFRGIEDFQDEISFAL